MTHAARLPTILILAILIAAGCGCQAKSSLAKDPGPDLAAVAEQGGTAVKALGAEIDDLAKQLDTAGAAVDASARDLQEFLTAVPDPMPASVQPVVAAEKRLEQTAAPAIAVAKIDTQKIEDLVKQFATLTQSIAKIRQDVKALAKDRDSGWREADVQKTRADDGLRRDFVAVGALGLLALGLGIYLCFTGNLKIGALAVGGGLAVIIGAAVGVWLVDHWWQVTLALVGAGGLAVLAALAWHGKLGAKAQADVRAAVLALDTGHVDNAIWLGELEAKVVALEGRLVGAPAAPASAPAAAPTPATAPPSGA